MKIKQLMMKYASCLASLALVAGVSTTTQACWWWFAQPKMPDGLSKFTKE